MLLAPLWDSIVVKAVVIVLFVVTGLVPAVVIWGWTLPGPTALLVAETKTSDVTPL